MRSSRQRSQARLTLGLGLSSTVSELGARQVLALDSDPLLLDRMLMVVYGSGTAIPQSYEGVPWFE